jgi:hypothetical protein
MRGIMPVIIDQTGRPFNVDEVDGISGRHNTDVQVSGAIQVSIQRRRNHEWVGRQGQARLLGRRAERRVDVDAILLTAPGGVPRTGPGPTPGSRGSSARAECGPR